MQPRGIKTRTSEALISRGKAFRGRCWQVLCCWVSLPRAGEGQGVAVPLQHPAAGAEMAKGPCPRVFLGVVGTFIPVLFFSCSPDVGSWLQLEALLGWT